MGHERIPRHGVGVGVVQHHQALESGKLIAHGSETRREALALHDRDLGGTVADQVCHLVW